MGMERSLVCGGDDEVFGSFAEKTFSRWSSIATDSQLDYLGV